MFADSLPTNAWLSCEMRPSRLQHAVIQRAAPVLTGWLMARFLGGRNFRASDNAIAYRSTGA